MKLQSSRLVACTVLTVTLGAIAACNNQPATQTVAPSATPAVLPTGTPSMPPMPSAQPSGLFSAAGFRDDFTETALDPTVWQSFAQNGLITFSDGHLQLISPSASVNFPYLVTKKPIIPVDGPYFFEFGLRTNVVGNYPVAFMLDYLPPTKPNAPPVSIPFMVFQPYIAQSGLTFATEDGPYTVPLPAGAIVGSPAFGQLRIEDDAQNHYRVIFNHYEIGRFTSTQRPSKFWVGAYPLADAATPGTWPWISLDHVAAGPLTAADPATPFPAATPAPAGR